MNNNIRKQRVLSMAADGLLIFASCFASGGGDIPFWSGHFLITAAIYSLVLVNIFAGLQLYDREKRSAFSAGLLLLSVNGIGVLGLMALLYILRIMDFSRLVLATFWMLSSLLLIGKRLLIQLALHIAQSRGCALRHIAVAGSGALAQRYIRELQNTPNSGCQIDGTIGSGGFADCPYLGSFVQMEQILAERNLDEVVVALEPEEASVIRHVLQAAGREGLRITLVPIFSEFIPAQPTIRTVGSTALINMRSTPLDQPGWAMVKRAVDIVGSLALIVLTGPLMLVVALGVRLSSPGPIIFRQNRIGKDKKPFQMLKFRSMRVNNKENTGWSRMNDSRKTRFGSFIRRYSLDELPQLFNVLRGDMSLVGPRPEIPYHVERFKRNIPLYLVRQQIRPGMTGWAQVNGLRGDTSIEDRVEYDIWYIENWSLWLDIRILLKTAFGGIVSPAEGEGMPVDVKIVVATHKHYPMPKDPLYLPVQAGRTLHDDLGYTGDDTGDQISIKNDGYCELTALYWAWKNLDAEVIGLCHYRRYFAGKPVGSKWKRILTHRQAQRLLKNADILLPKPRNYWIETNYSQYAHAHHGKDLDTAREVLSQRFPEYLPAFDRVMARTWGHRFNMLIARREVLDRYCAWLFDILGELEQRIDLSGYSAYDRRVFGFLAERLLDMWLETERPRYRELAVVNMESQHWPKKIAAFLTRKIRAWKC